LVVEGGRASERWFYRLAGYPVREGASMTRLLHHTRSNAIAYLALFVALGGTSYAAISLGPGSVGTPQLKSGAVTARKLAAGAVSSTKLDRGSIGGSVRHWAQVNAGGKIVGSSSKARVAGAPVQGGYAISWADSFSSHCAAIATPTASSLLVGPSSGYANAKIEGVKSTSVVVDTYNAQGQPAPAAFSVAVIC
jgi:hypothetical protein